MRHQCGHLIPSVRNIFKILGCHKRDNTTHKSLGKAKLTSAEGCALDKESEKQAHGVGSLLGLHVFQNML
jgi:hypothetical protein